MMGRSPTEKIIETPKHLLDPRYRTVVGVDHRNDSTMVTISRFNLETGQLIGVEWEFCSGPGIAAARHPSAPPVEDLWHG